MTSGNASGWRWTEVRSLGVASAAAAHQLAECFAEADQLMKSAPRGLIAREHINKGRQRLDKA